MFLCSFPLKVFGLLVEPFNVQIIFLKIVSMFESFAEEKWKKVFKIIPKNKPDD